MCMHSFGSSLLSYYVRILFRWFCDIYTVYTEYLPPFLSLGQCYHTLAHFYCTLLDSVNQVITIMVPLRGICCLRQHNGCVCVAMCSKIQWYGMGFIENISQKSN